MAAEPVLWDHLSWTDVADLVTATRAAIIPVGAVEQHGPHLPLNTDWILATEVATRISAHTGVPVVPPLAYGISGSHGGWPGTISLRPHTLSIVLRDIADSLYRSGVRQFVFLNAHAWNLAGLYTVLEDLRCAHNDARVKVANWWDTVEDEPEMSVDCPHTADISHANYAETSCMLYLRPALVHMNRAVNETDDDFFWDYRMDQISRTGVLGRDATGASAAVGQKLVELASLRFAERLTQGLATDFPYSPDWSLGNP